MTIGGHDGARKEVVDGASRRQSQGRCEACRSERPVVSDRPQSQTHGARVDRRRPNFVRRARQGGGARIVQSRW
jgi:hypothetical protein